MHGYVLQLPNGEAVAAKGASSQRPSRSFNLTFAAYRIKVSRYYDVLREGSVMRSLLAVALVVFAGMFVLPAAGIAGPPAAEYIVVDAVEAIR